MRRFVLLSLAVAALLATWNIAFPSAYKTRGQLAEGSKSDEDREDRDAPKNPLLSQAHSKWDPPANIPHLESTPPAMRAKIDRYIDALLDPFAGQHALDAKEILVVIGKPAFPRLLGRMAYVRDEMTDVNSHEELLMERSLGLADEALRNMDGWLTMKEKPVLRPGITKDYLRYICRIHYKRWEQELKHLHRMPGPYDPSEQYMEK
jgi:hypothetical protein